MKGGLPAGKPCQYLHRAGKLTRSPLSLHAMQARHGDRNTFTTILATEGGGGAIMRIALLLYMSLTLQVKSPYLQSSQVKSPYLQSSYEIQLTIIIIIILIKISEKEMMIR